MSLQHPTRRIACNVLILAGLLLAMPATASHSLPRDVDLHGAGQVFQVLDKPLLSPMPRHTVNSGFGWRVHPVLKRTRFHAGIDFRAPAGTPVLASGDGVVEKISRHRDRGLYVLVRHGERVQTGYAHLSGLAAGLAVGQAIRAGETIAYVGRSGRATGAHLDFEVFLDGRRVDPDQVLALALAPPGHPAAGSDWSTFGSGKLVTFREFAQ